MHDISRDKLTICCSQARFACETSGKMCQKFGGRIKCRDRYELWIDATSEESMVKDVMQHGALLRVKHKNLLHKLVCIWQDILAR
jgi:hypothetical protein